MTERTRLTRLSLAGTLESGVLRQYAGALHGHLALTCANNGLMYITNIILMPNDT